MIGEKPIDEQESAGAAGKAASAARGAPLNRETRTDAALRVHRTQPDATGQIQKGQLDVAVEGRRRSRILRKKPDDAGERPGGAEADQATQLRQAAIKTRDIVIFTRQFATMINAGLPLVQSLDILAQADRERGAQGRHAAGGVRRRGRQHPGRRARASTPRRSPTSTSTWSRPARRAVSWTRSCCAWRRSWRRTTPWCAR